MDEAIAGIITALITTTGTIGLAAIAAYKGYAKMTAQIAALQDKLADQDKTIAAQDIEMAEIKKEHNEAMEELKQENRSLRLKVADLYERLAMANANGNGRSIF